MTLVQTNKDQVFKQTYNFEAFLGVEHQKTNLNKSSLTYVSKGHSYMCLLTFLWQFLTHIWYIKTKQFYPRRTEWQNNLHGIYFTTNWLFYWHLDFKSVLFFISMPCFYIWVCSVCSIILWTSYRKICKVDLKGYTQLASYYVIMQQTGTLQITKNDCEAWNYSTLLKKKKSMSNCLIK